MFTLGNFSKHKSKKKTSKKEKIYCKITLSNWFLLLVVNIRSLINILFAHSALRHTESQTLFGGRFASDVNKFIVINLSSLHTCQILCDVAYKRFAGEFVIYSFTHQQTHTRQQKFRIKFQETPLRSFSAKFQIFFTAKVYVFAD